MKPREVMGEFLNVCIMIAVFAAAGAMAGYVTGFVLAFWLAPDEDSLLVVPWVFDVAWWGGLVGGIAGSCLGVRCVLTYLRVKAGAVGCLTRLSSCRSLRSRS